MKTRIYCVTDSFGKAERLVRAAHPSNALMHVARKAYAVRVASQDDMLALVSRGIAVEDIGHEQMPIEGGSE